MYESLRLCFTNDKFEEEEEETNIQREREKRRPGLEPLTIKRRWRADASFAQLEWSSVALGSVSRCAARRALCSEWCVCVEKGKGGRRLVQGGGSPRLSLVRARLRWSKPRLQKMTVFFSLLLLKQTPHWTDLRASAKPLFPPAASQTLHRVGLNYRNIMQRDVVFIWGLTSVRRKKHKSPIMSSRFLNVF